MPSTERPILCVSIHDVAPATWADCARLHAAVRAVADIPVSWLVVPCYRGRDGVPAAYQAAADALLRDGHELVLHGYTHVDDGPPPRGLLEHIQRRVLTEGEGEFAALGVEQARRRLELGMAWFRRRGWPLAGFVAPAWMMGPGAWEALRGSSLRYAGGFRYLHVLASGRACFAPTLVYAARNRSGRLVSPPLAGALAALHWRTPVLRLALHPRDAQHPALLRHAQALLARLLAQRTPMTEASLALR